MSRRMIFPALILGLSSLVGPVVHADTASQARQQIQADYNSYDAAMDRKDAQGAIAHIDPSFIGGNPGKHPETYQDLAATLPDMFTHIQSSHTHTRIQKIVLKGATAAVQARNHFTITVFDPSAGHTQSITVEGNFSDTWIKRPSGWMLLRRSNISKKRIH